MSCRRGTPHDNLSLPVSELDALDPFLQLCTDAAAQGSCVCVCVCSLTRRGAEHDLGGLDPPWLEAGSQFPAGA